MLITLSSWNNVASRHATGSTSSIYLDFSHHAASFEIYINDQDAVIDVGVLQNCTFNPLELSMGDVAAAEIRIFVTGLASDSSGSDWWFEFNSFLCVIVSFTSRLRC
jgi:hypothetical protein